ncbi:MAG: hypothetical protein E5Y55_26215 [Mesorhizobium sp.]|uniref:hypothetical protein n=1 Tax=Mesorhizobium sp. TaxID=1871066 RepID=UPI0011FBAEAA|nr:hypothetical protein [Mesorhizobium sp.]TIM41070.1 MAG: hypothetical protein E5Y55_26215 [Mesorhizobium sp.]
MSLRLADIAVGLIGLAAGAAMTPGTVSGDAGRVLATFLGLLSAGLLPTITLLINSMTASGRSVQAIDRLEGELKAAMDALFLLFGCVVLSIGALVSLSIQPANFLTRVPYLTTEILPRIGQSLVIGPTTLVVWRAGRIPAILRRALEIRREIAVDEAKRKIIEKAPTTEALRQGYATQESFGRAVSLQDLQARERQ